MGTEAASRTVWRQSTFLILLSGQWISQLGDVAFNLALYWYVLTATHRPVLLGLVGALAGVGNLFAVVSGVWVDRWNRRTILIVTDTIRGVLILGLLAWILQQHHFVLVALGVTVLLVNIGGSMFNPAMMAFTPQVITSDQLMQANGVLQSAAYIAQLAGYAFGGVMIALLGVNTLFLTDGISFWVSAFSLIFVRPLREVPSSQKGPLRTLGQFWAELREGQHLIWRHPFLRRALPIALVVNMALMPLNVLDVVWVRRVLHLGPLAYAGFGAALLVGMIGGSMLASRVFKRLVVTTTIILCLAVSGGSLVLLSRVPLFSVTIGCLFGIGVSFGVLNTGLATLIQQATPKALLGRVAGARMTASGVANPFAAAIAGFATERWPVSLILGVAGLVLAAASALFIGAPRTIEPLEADSASKESLLGQGEAST